jgi:hypothetical protein
MPIPEVLEQAAFAPIRVEVVPRVRHVQFYSGCLEQATRIVLKLPQAALE